MEKRFCFFLIVILFSFVALFGCKTDEVLRSANAIYLDIKTVVTAPGVREKIPPVVMVRLAQLELIYLSAAQDIKATGVENSRPITVVVDCADEFLQIINTMALNGKYEKEIKAIGIAIDVLKNHIQRE